MKRLSLVISGIIICAICFYQLLSVPAEKKIQSDVPVPERPVEKVQRRASITFILGEDKDLKNRYYEEATLYYSHNQEGKTDLLITHCRSLLEVRNYLDEYKPANGLPWGLINLVSHGNQWTGLSVRVTGDSKRATVARLKEYTAGGMLNPLPEIVIDSQTEVFIHGCGIGNNPELMRAIAQFFGGKDNMPIVHASKLFEYYASVQHNGRINSQRYLARTWMVNYRMGEQPDAIVLMNEFREKYPYAQVDWRSALSRSKPGWVGDVYHYTFEVPVKWIIPVESDSIAKLKDAKNQLEWIRTQQQITDELANLQIPSGKFNWSFTNVYIDHEDGSRSPAVWVKGYSTIFTVLQALIDDETKTSVLARPFKPELNDEKYYTTVSGTFKDISSKNEKRLSGL